MRRVSPCERCSDGGWARSRARGWGPSALAFALVACAPPPPGDLPPEPTITADTPPAGAGNTAPAGGVDFADGMRISEVSIAPTPMQPGAQLTLSMRITGAAESRRARVSLRTPQSAARQQVRGGPPPADPRDRGQIIDLTEGTASVIFEVPTPWHPRSAVIELEAQDDAGARVPAIRGPRSDDGRAFLAVVPVLGTPTQVVAPRIAAPRLDGVVDAAAGEWTHAPSVLVDSLHGEPWPPSETEVWFGWDDDHLYVAGKVVDPDLYSTFTTQDDPLYRQEALEIFVAGTDTGRRYLELQASARGVTFDARFPAYRKGDEAWDSSWRIGVHAGGTVDGPVDRDQGWALEAAIPWAEICEETDVTCPVGQGTKLRVNVFRLERVDRKETRAWALSPTRAPDFHAWANAAVLELR